MPLSTVFESVPMTLNGVSLCVTARYDPMKSHGCTQGNKSCLQVQAHPFIQHNRSRTIAVRAQSAPSQTALS